ncbi:MAG: thrombospondin type 3 repeat-containing protein [Candidatus Vogelbacteria bacterium]|nr:thrombospondin type 3 repeat-containing protein [Candidatus Vogelbacteria bacterium]
MKKYLLGLVVLSLIITPIFTQASIFSDLTQRFFSIFSKVPSQQQLGLVGANGQPVTMSVTVKDANGNIITSAKIGDKVKVFWRLSSIPDSVTSEFTCWNNFAMQEVGKSVTGWNDKGYTDIASVKAKGGLPTSNETGVNVTITQITDTSRANFSDPVTTAGGVSTSGLRKFNIACGHPDANVDPLNGEVMVLGSASLTILPAVASYTITPAVVTTGSPGNPSLGGSITPSSPVTANRLPPGQISRLDFTVTPKTGYQTNSVKFKAGTMESRINPLSGSNTYRLTNTQVDGTITATFGPITATTVTVLNLDGTPVSAWTKGVAKRITWKKEAFGSTEDMVGVALCRPGQMSLEDSRNDVCIFHGDVRNTDSFELEADYASDARFTSTYQLYIFKYGSRRFDSWAGNGKSSPMTFGVLAGGWTVYPTCPVSGMACGTSVTQTRTCTNPTPAGGGANCSGLDGGASSRVCSAPACSTYIVSTLVKTYKSDGTTLDTIVGGTITPASIAVNRGASKQFTITPNTGYSLSADYKSVDVDGVNPLVKTETCDEWAVRDPKNYSSLNCPAGDSGYRHSFTPATGGSFTITPTKDLLITAKFVPSINPLGPIQISGTSQVYQGEQIKLAWTLPEGMSQARRCSGQVSLGTANLNPTTNRSIAGWGVSNFIENGNYTSQPIDQTMGGGNKYTFNISCQETDGLGRSASGSYDVTVLNKIPDGTSPTVRLSVASSLDNRLALFPNTLNFNWLSTNATACYYSFENASGEISNGHGIELTGSTGISVGSCQNCLYQVWVTCSNASSGESASAYGSLKIGQGNIGDNDGDKIPNAQDQCENTPPAPGVRIGTDGCYVNPADNDHDGVPNAIDQCPDTPMGVWVHYENGCAIDPSEDDADGDRVPDGSDNCPNTPAGGTVDHHGCTIVIDSGQPLVSGSWVTVNSDGLKIDFNFRNFFNPASFGQTAIGGESMTGGTRVPAPTNEAIVSAVGIQLHNITDSNYQPFPGYSLTSSFSQGFYFKDVSSLANPSKLGNSKVETTDSEWLKSLYGKTVSAVICPLAVTGLDPRTSFTTGSCFESLPYKVVDPNDGCSDANSICSIPSGQGCMEGECVCVGGQAKLCSRDTPMPPGVGCQKTSYCPAGPSASLSGRMVASVGSLFNSVINWFR